MANKQPFYHRAVIGIEPEKAGSSPTRKDIEKMLSKLKLKGLVKGSADCEEIQIRAVVLFTATRDVSSNNLEKALVKLDKGASIETLWCESIDAEPGDPSDLM